MTAGLRFRFTINGQVMFDGLLDQADDVEAVAAAHAELVQEANAGNLPWRVEVIDPDGIVPTIRIGTLLD